MSIFETLAGVDTGTLCNAMIVLDPSLRGKNYTLDAVVAANAGMPPFTGYALTAKIVSDKPTKDSHDTTLARRFAYYRYLQQARRPSLVVMEDCGERRGMGCIWGEIQVSIHKAMGLVGAVTNGAIRDIGTLPAGIGLLGGNVCPGSGFAHLVEFDTPVSVFGLPVSPGDLVHADRHGCVVIPAGLVDALPAAIARVAQREQTFLAALDAPGLDADKLAVAWRVFEVK
ncbi:bifunctional hexulose-6-phosphate synthase/ribonuclease regulator (plasmid) [Variovorax sp. SRS16]|uniref:RraA family protein n=1 Tax=Variovorax sp. SRS16 TaxID=282217 RepID=UPI0013185E94|nr:RraA family protein [Variovorax sp. SRS16]VTU46538.1 bifunctional hexulose-6-phosphate synthase/ribonuclease regulator [Variovorax sp. SRS16]